ncbi:MAG TPA: class I SAM-dependent methyltransferase [Candidatus Polarisedimenticolaceae bacterium]|nr:class I SAM-dependent methyltransferase [Candidatus Polarisedimenticolaceae bacterium]
MARKDFAPIEADYEFFRTHSTEAQHDAEDYARRLGSFADDREAIAMLDFGCGAGAFTETFLERMSWPPERLTLSLIEPVTAQREHAAARLARFSAETVRHAAALTRGSKQRFDLVLSNHVLYYVEDLAGTLGELVGRLRPGGRLLLAMADRANALIDMWDAGFGALGRAVPYHTAEDVVGVLESAGLHFATTESRYVIRFEDRPSHRLSILRFLFGEHLDRMPREKLLAGFDRYVSRGAIEIATHDLHFDLTLDGS